MIELRGRDARGRECVVGTFDSDEDAARFVLGDPSLEDDAIDWDEVIRELERQVRRMVDVQR